MQVTMTFSLTMLCCSAQQQLTAAVMLLECDVHAMCSLPSYEEQHKSIKQGYACIGKQGLQPTSVNMATSRQMLSSGP